RQIHDHLAVKPARTQQSRVQYVRTVGSGNHNHTFTTLETIHFHQQLVQGLLTLIVPATQASAPMATHSVDLVDKNNTGRLFLGLLKHVAHTGGTHTHKHFHEVRAGNREEGHLRLAGNGFSQKRLTGTGRADHQHATGNPATQTLEFAGITQELHQLLHILFGLINTGHVREGGLDLVLAHQAGFALAEGHGAFAAATALHLPHEEHEHGNDDQNGERSHQQLGPDALALWLTTDDRHPVVDQAGHKIRIMYVGADGFKTCAILTLSFDDQPVNCHPLHLAIFHQRHKVGVAHLLGCGLRIEVVEHSQQHRRNDEP